MGKIERRGFLFKRQEKLDISCADILAAVLFLVMFGWYIYVAFIGLNPADESFYYTIPQRIFQGDRLFVDEWHVSQLSSLFQVLPYKIFTAVTGGTDGIILYMRFVTIVVTAVFYWFFYKKLRAYKAWGVLVTFLLCSFFPGGMLALSYYTISIYMLAVVCIVLFLSKNELTMITLILLGVAFSCAVLAQPVLVILFLFYSLLCLVCSRTKTLFHSFDFVLNFRTWRGIAIGCFVSFLCFFAFLAIKSGLTNIISTIPELFGDTDYDLSFNGVHIQALEYKIKGVFRFYGMHVSFLAVAVSIISLVTSRINKRSWKIKTGLFAVASVLLLAQVICGILSFRNQLKNIDHSQVFFYYFYLNFPFTWFGLTCYGLCEKKPPQIFAFWIIGEAASVLVAYASQGFLTFGGEISNIATVLLFGMVVSEYKSFFTEVNRGRNKPKHHPKRAKQHVLIRDKRLTKMAIYALRVVVVVCVCSIVCWRSITFYFQGIHPYVETQASSFSDKRIRTTIEKGPHKGIRTTKELAEKYEDILEDLDQIAAGSKGQAVYFAGNCLFYYLYLDLPCGAYSVAYVDADSETRQCRYWELHPERRPKYYYIPLYVDSLDFSTTWANEQERMNEKLGFIQKLAVCNIVKGKAGYLVEIAKWL